MKKIPEHLRKSSIREHPQKNWIQELLQKTFHLPRWTNRHSLCSMWYLAATHFPSSLVHHRRCSPEQTRNRRHKPKASAKVLRYREGISSYKPPYFLKYKQKSPNHDKRGKNLRKSAFSGVLRHELTKRLVYRQYRPSIGDPFRRRRLGVLKSVVNTHLVVLCDCQ